MDITYIESMRSHIAQLESELDGLTEIATKQALNRYEYRATERTLQITIEACIGIAKHWCKKIEKNAPASSYQSFEILASHKIQVAKKVPWKQIIGMRNALVHDYLNIDPDVIKQLLLNSEYKALIVFALKGLEALKAE